ncbi:hypothetical protein [Yokenella regensburgei]|uniref:hypothetical protein n=1 Tax=Yokenella regensburgei TaxID=158877 RepID=UPI0013758EF3|nr:hypothetical protein [Yokenella regensburgei]KAF1368756.1 hypothetical protein FHR25_002506 [Yokenella regensburgei]
MKIEFNDHGAWAAITLTSTVFEFRRHIRIVDTVRMCTPGVSVNRCGFFLMKTLISGPSNKALRAYKTAQREAKR